MKSVSSLPSDHRAVTANTRWIQPIRKHTRSSITTSVIRPTTTRGVGSRRASHGHLRTAMGRQKVRPNKSHAPTLPLCHRCLLCCPTTHHLHRPRARARCSGLRVAGLPLHLCCPLRSTASTASTGLPAAWAPPPRPQLQASRPLFDMRLWFRSQHIWLGLPCEQQFAPSTSLSLWFVNDFIY